MEKEPKLLLNKIFEAKKQIAGTKMQKEGKNDFAKYKYFTPDQVTKLVNDACFDQKLLTEFRIIEGERGYEACFSIVCVETGEMRDYRFPAVMPEIKGANASQQMGGAITYFERYCKMSVFGIVDNNLDFDSSIEKKTAVTKTTTTPKETISQATIENAINEINGFTKLSQLHDFWNNNKRLQQVSEIRKLKDKLKLTLK